MTTELNVEKALKLIGSFFLIGGLVFIAFSDWKIALGLFFVLWGRNMGAK